MRRVLVWFAVILAGFVAIAGCIAFAIGWDGTWLYQTLRAGDSVTLESGLTLTVPPGYEGFHSKFLHMPRWIPLGEGATGLQRSEDFFARSVSAGATSTLVMSTSYYGDGKPTARFKGLATRDGVTVFAPVGAGPAGVRTELPGHPTGWLVARSGQPGPESTMRAVWAQFRVKGAALP